MGKRRTIPLGPDGQCHECGQRHVTHHGRIACAGHISDGSPGMDKPHAGRACRRPPSPGLAVCVKHGGAAPQAREAGRRRVAEERARKAMEKFAGPIDTTPTEALLDAVKWCAGYVMWLRGRLDDDNHDTAVIELLGEWTTQLRHLCVEAIRCGIEERRVRFAEQQGQQVADVIKAILTDDELGLTKEQLARVGNVVPRHLRGLMRVA